jgi:hypothetical protein
LVCRDMYPENPRGAGTGPLNSEHTPSPFTCGTYWEFSLSATWDLSGKRSYHTKEGFQVSERGIEKGARGISKGKKRARGLRHVYR